MSSDDTRGRALIVDDDRDGADGLAEWLEGHGFAARIAGDVAGAREALDEGAYDLILLDLQLPDGTGLELLQHLELQAQARVVFVTGHGSIDSAVEAVRGGAVDYLTKPIDFERLASILIGLEDTIALRREIDELRGELRRLGRFGSMVGASAAMQRVYDLISRVAPTSSSVLVTGETGTGKELVARSVHRLSPRAGKPFVAINCGAIQPSLVESELFGHEKGSFTGAERQHRGVFERADGGTLFLDEVTEMPMELQVRLLRVLETRTLSRVGSEKPIEVDVRLVAATNRDPAGAVADGKLREDLLYRLNVFPIALPGLRERREDVPLLADFFVARQNEGADSPKRLTDDARRALAAHAWPGNVRELRNVVERSYIMAPGEAIDVDCLSLGGGAAAPVAAGGGLGVSVGMSIKDAERLLILATLEQLDGDKSAAADMLGISLKTLYNRLNAYEASQDGG